MNFAIEVHPTEIAFDIASAHRALEAVKNHKRFGFTYDPFHLGYQGVDYAKFLRGFKDRIFHAHMKDAWWGQAQAKSGSLVVRPILGTTGDIGTFAQSITAISGSKI